MAEWPFWQGLIADVRMGYDKWDTTTEPGQLHERRLRGANHQSLRCGLHHFYNWKIEDNTPYAKELDLKFN